MNSVDDLNTIREEICMLRKNRVKQEHLEHILRKKGSSMPMAEYKQLIELREKNKMVENWLEILNEDESYVIRRHLIDEVTWPRICAEYAAQWGVFEKSIRTLMRYQSNALNKILAFINEL